MAGFKIRSKAVIYELLDREIILADLDSGIYYSIRGGGVPIWQLLLSGHSAHSIKLLLQKQYGTSDGVDGFVDLLLQEQILVPSHKSFTEFNPSFPVQHCARAQQLDASCLHAPHNVERENLGVNSLKNFCGQVLVSEESSAQLPPDFSWPMQFEPPMFERYEEMKNLLILDPIHEVDEQGWPARSGPV